MTPYDHKEIEKKWQARWKKSGAYKTKEQKGKEKFYVLDMFPYPSGEGLHVGHPKGYIATDVYSRFMRMQGHSVLHPMGFDAFGLPAENYALKTKTNPEASVKENVKRYKSQLEQIGLDYDWSREINTTDPGYYKWTQWIFLQMFKAGLAYESHEPINWCPSCKTGLANEDVEDGRCERCGTAVEKKPLRQWVLKITDYAEKLLDGLKELDWPESIKELQKNWIGKSEGAEIEFKLDIPARALPKKILVGTRNQAKIKMVKEAFPASLGIEFVSLEDYPNVDDSNLTEGDDFRENARQKSEFYFKKTGLPTISTDHILWIEKYQENKGFIVHIRKLANPDSPRATDKEVAEWVENFVDKHGESKAAFHYALAYTDKDGTVDFSIKQREYILQKTKSPKNNEGYVFDRYLKDPETGELRVEQKFIKGFGFFVELINNDFLDLFSKQKVKVFTTRADTLFGATYLVLAPEQELVLKIKRQISNWDEVVRYIVQTKAKSEIERTTEGKEKTGVELKGIKALNPANNEEIPVFVADYVLAGYGTGAIMAVPAHDERDWQFATKYKLPITYVIAPHIEAKNDPLVPGKRVVPRKAVQCFVFDPKTKKYLFLKWKTTDWRGPVTGGVEGGEDVVAAGIREIHEETGYKNIKFVRDLGCPKRVDFYHPAKDENRYAQFIGLLFELSDSQQDNIAEEEINRHEILWLSQEEVLKFINAGEEYFDRIGKENSAYTGGGVLINSGKFDELDFEQAKKQVTDFVGGKSVTKYKLRDWVFSRQRYWGEPIPLIHCAKCGVVAVPEKDLPVTLPKVSHYEPTGTGESPLAGIAKWANVKCPKCKGPGRRETNTMPQWAGSSWYWIRYMDPKNKKRFVDAKKEKYWSPVDFYVGGAEHATRHLIYARFWHRFLFDNKLVAYPEPFKKLQHVGLILAEDGRKMSKRWENVINPDDIIERFGADSLRVYEMFMGPFDQAVSWNTDNLVGSRRFLERVWRLGEKVNGEKQKTIDKELEVALHRTIQKVTDDIIAFKFNTAISQLMIFTNILDKKDLIPRETFRSFLLLLAPFAPHMSEELWNIAGGKVSINKVSWPLCNENLLKEVNVTVSVQVNGKSRGTIELPPRATQEEAFNQAIKSPQIQKWIGSGKPRNIVYVEGRILSIVV